jgi:hypothetical protein
VREGVAVAETRAVIKGINCQHSVVAVKKAQEGVLGILERDVPIRDFS